MGKTGNMTEIMNTRNLTELISESEIIKYSLGGLMYTPAHNKKVSAFLSERRYRHLRSLALCLEDAIADGSENEAIEQIVRTFGEIKDSVDNGVIAENDLPYLFIRVKTPEQIILLTEKITDCRYLTGFIFPKFDMHNAQIYMETISKINRNTDNIIYGMPILESLEISDIRNRIRTLSEIKDVTDSFRDLIVNIRIGGNDFCSRFGVRRNITDSIYNISAVSSIIGDIINIFSDDYVISAPVWDYFSNGDLSDISWSEGLRNEMEMDILNGMIGKTAVHPSQLSVIDDVLSVSYEDYHDALSILEWNNTRLAVSKGISGNRMNEEKVHRNWAEKILIRADVYGVRETERNI